MTDLTDYLGGPFRPPLEKRIDPPDTQLYKAIMDAGLEPPGQIIMDGKIHRFKSGARGRGGAGDKTGWYIAYPDGIPAGRFGCWRAGIEQTWRADAGKELSVAEQMAHSRRMAEAQAARDIERKRTQEVAGDVVDRIWSDAGAASPDHPYLKSKRIEPHGARITGDGRLIVPLCSEDGTLASLQYIDSEGGKKYHPGGAAGGKFWSVGAADAPGTVYIAEGYATASTIYETTHRPCFVSYSAGNLSAVAEIVRKQHAEVIIVADNDSSGVGFAKANEAATKWGCHVVMPPMPGDANDYANGGHDLVALLSRKPDNWLMPADAFCDQPAPISWLIKGWIQSDAVIMIHGPSGGGKTFVVLDMCLNMASGGGSWFGHRTSAANVVYLAGEGHHGLKGRIAAWKVKRKVKHLDMWVSKSGLDLNTVNGYQQTVSSLRQLDVVPNVIVIDTLHRFLHGDENSAQDTKTMLDACSALQQEFKCAVILVHHTGVSEEAQHRARGSSAWRGAMDVEISIIPSKNGSPIEIIQRKSKDSELAQPLYAELYSVEIPGWIDEDGEQVTSAVLEQELEPTGKPRENDFASQVKILERAWWHSGAEDRDGSPYVTKSAILELLEADGIKPSTAANYIKPSYSNGLVAKLLNAEIISPMEHGWVVIEDGHCSAMMIRKGA